MRLEVDTTSCTVSWHGCRETYNAVHTCDRTQRHDGRHRCVCGATKAKAKRSTRRQPACGNTEPHRPHNGFASMDPEPWCTGVASPP